MKSVSSQHKQRVQHDCDESPIRHAIVYLDAEYTITKLLVVTLLLLLPRHLASRVLLDALGRPRALLSYSHHPVATSRNGVTRCQKKTNTRPTPSKMKGKSDRKVTWNFEVQRTRTSLNRDSLNPS